MNYPEFIASKDRRAHSFGFDPEDIMPALFQFQSDIVRWAIRKGRAAIFADCGLGKTPMQLEWARRVCEKENGRVLIIAPLAVSAQTEREGRKFGIAVRVCKTSADLKDKINITNYERLHYFSPSDFVGIVLDESSILKSYDGVYRRQLTAWASGLRYRLCCTATPAPNDLIELTNHSEFLGVMSGKEVIGSFFTQDGNTSHVFRLRGHARSAFWEWLASWAVALRAPSDLDYADDDFILPQLNIHDVVIRSQTPLAGTLFCMPASTLAERRTARSHSLPERVEKMAEIVAERPNDQWIIWCNLNAESTALTRAIENSVEVKGADSVEHKEKSMIGFQSGDIQILVTKPTIAGFGMNWQNCHNVGFVGLSDSYEQYYQAIRRCWRFGQKSPVDVHIITSVLEGKIVQNVKRKEREASDMFSELVKRMNPYEHIRENNGRLNVTGETTTRSGKDWTMILGDCVMAIPSVADETVGLTIFSPPFPGMYAYTDSLQDMGNTTSNAEMLGHFSFLVPELFRVTIPGRSCCIHLTQSPIFKGRDGYVGLRDFRGDVIKLMESEGWIYYGEATIDKDPQVKAARTKDHSLLFKTLSGDSADCRMALADYLLQFRKPGKNPFPVHAGYHPRWNPNGGWITPDEWIEWAAPVWYRANEAMPGGIRETDVLNVRAAREKEDERHLCPLQLGVIERAVKLWSCPGDLVFSPFAGIGSEGFVALQLGRRFTGIELKESYWTAACRNLSEAKSQTELFSA
jgi:DNA modification methylase